MSINKIEIDLTGVPQTLLLPLLGRAEYSQKSYSPIHDEHAIQLVKAINYDFKSLLSQIGDTTLFWMARAYHFDEAIKAYLKKHESATIVNLGAGLETAFYRVDNGKLTWVDLDLPEVIMLRKKLLPPHARVNYIEKSILDYSWMDDIKKLGDNIFLFAGGLFMYFTELQVKSLFTEMAARLPQAELIFDSISSKALRHANKMLSQANMKNAPLQWGLNNSKEITAWSSHIKLVSQIPYFKNIKIRYQFPILLRLKMFFYDWTDKPSILHVKFSSSHSST